VAGYKFGYASEKEALDAALAVGADDDEVGMAVGCGVDDALTDVADADHGFGFESGGAELVRGALDEFLGKLIVFCKFGCVAGTHLGWRRSDGLQDVQDQDVSVIGMELRRDCPDEAGGEGGIVDSKQDFHDVILYSSEPVRGVLENECEYRRAVTWGL
jgi:hypothetical protein